MRLSTTLGSGFACLQHAELLRVLMLICNLTLAVDMHHRGAIFAPKIWDLALVRNAVHHRLSSLDPPPPSVLTSHTDSLYNVTRLSAMIYNDLVVFPTSSLSGVQARLAYDLRKALGTIPSTTPNWLEQADLLFWCTVMGAVASHNIPIHREWFVQKIAAKMDDDSAGLHKWRTFRDFLSRFLWWEFVLQMRCYDVWSEAMFLRLRGPEIAGPVV
jgi:hypothetical protein